MLLKNINGIIQFLLFFFCQMNFNDIFYPIGSQLNRNGGKGIMNTILSVQPGRTWQNLVFIMEDSTDKFRGGRTYTKLCAALVRIFKITTAMYLM